LIFSEFYAECYDQIHSAKNYQSEVDKILNLIDVIQERRIVRKVLDFGCGTGMHLNSLDGTRMALFGYDRNSYMLQIARKKYPDLFLTSNYSLIPDDLDLIYSLFDVVSYQITDYELKTFFRELASKLAPGANLVIDGWHFPGVSKNPPEVRSRDISFRSSTITRRVTPSTSDGNRTTVLNIKLENKESSELLLNEDHTLRAFNAGEIEKVAVGCGFSKITFKDGGDWEKSLTTDSWRFVMFAHKS
jgi:SAM-dependent methyltransferase